MKKAVALMLAIATASAGISALAAGDSQMEKALVSVKSKVEIPSELTEFESSMYNQENNKSYVFRWHTEDGEKEIEVTTDGEGHIDRYYYYNNDFYNDCKYVYKPRAEYLSAAESFLASVVPELTVGEDHLVIKETDGTITGEARFIFERHIDGIPVKDNNAYVEVRYAGDKFVITDCVISWDYKTQFSEPEGSSIADSEMYYDKFPIELVYSKLYGLRRTAADQTGDTPALIYRFKDYNAGYVSVNDGSIVETDGDDFIFSRGAGAGNSAKAEVSADAALTPAERQEVENISGLKTPEQIINGINAMKVFGKMPPSSGFTTRTYKSDGKYYIDMYYSAAEEENNISYLNIISNGITGELLSYSCYFADSKHSAEYSENRYKAAETAMEGFINGNFADKVKLCAAPEFKENGASVTYKRLVNGVIYDNNRINASYDMENGVISYFDYEWDDDVSDFEKPEKAMSYDAARNKLEEYYPVHLVYVKSGDSFVLCCASDGAQAKINAVTGEDMNKSRDFAVYEYSDIKGHWAEEIIKAVAQYGAGLPGSEFMPDAKITQGELLKMLDGCRGYELIGGDDSIIDNEERSPDSYVLREDAFVYLIRLMGYEKIASLNDIFQPGFIDGTDVSPNKAGALAILRGFGIVRGDDVSVRPKDWLTRAEAAALVYNYLVTDK